MYRSIEVYRYWCNVEDKSEAMRPSLMYETCACNSWAVKVNDIRQYFFPIILKTPKEE